MKEILAVISDVNLTPGARLLLMYLKSKKAELINLSKEYIEQLEEIGEKERRKIEKEDMVVISEIISEEEEKINYLLQVGWFKVSTADLYDDLHVKYEWQAKHLRELADKGRIEVRRKGKPPHQEIRILNHTLPGEEE